LGARSLVNGSTAGLPGDERSICDACRQRKAPDEIRIMRLHVSIFVRRWARHGRDRDPNRGQVFGSETWEIRCSKLSRLDIRAGAPPARTAGRSSSRSCRVA
jgi:hypothetical protein